MPRLNIRQPLNFDETTIQEWVADVVAELNRYDFATQEEMRVLENRIKVLEDADSS